MRDAPGDENNYFVHEFRRHRLVHVETNLLNKFPSDYNWFFAGKSKSDVQELPKNTTEPIGLTFSDGSMMLLWARPGKNFKVWT